MTDGVPANASLPAASTLAWFHCFAGIAGDMALGALLDAGADLAEVTTLLERLGLPGWRLEVEPALRGGISCTRAIVAVDEATPTSRTHADITALIARAALPPRVTQRAQAAFDRLGSVEAALHGCALTDVHFHEVGGHDALVDIVGTACALEVLDVDEVWASPVATGTGMVRAAHGALPNPAPATVRLLEGVPSYGCAVPVELTTPTGAALLTALCTGFGPLPAMTVQASGFGGGAAELDDLPNCTQVVIGTRDAIDGDGTDAGGEGQPVLALETNLDDVTGEQLGHAVSAVLEAGALDAWVSAVTMKKGRPGHVLHVLTDAAHLRTMRQVVRETTGTFGQRATPLTRWPAARTFTEVEVAGQTVRMKVGAGRAKPEFADVARVAAVSGLAIHDVASRAEEAWRRTQDGAPA